MKPGAVPALARAAVLAALIALAHTSIASAGWSSPTVIESGIDPVLVFGPAGDAAIGSSQMQHVPALGDFSVPVATFVATRSPHQSFRRPVRFGPVDAPGGFSNLGLETIVLPGDGATVALFGPQQDCGGCPVPIEAFLRRSGASAFGPEQQLAHHHHTLRQLAAAR